MKAWLKGALQNGLSWTGFRITRIPPEPDHRFSPPPEREFRWLRELGIRTVLDVGAHVGESAEKFRAIFPEARIHSFEPQSDCFRQLQEKFGSRPDHGVFRLALGDKPGRTLIRRSDYSPSSSLLPMGERHKRDFPFSSGHGEEEIEVATLDGIAPRLNLEEAVLLKIDTQGYEDKVLAGARETLRRVAVLIVECSFVPLYEGQALFPAIHAALAAQGFAYSGSWDQLLSPSDGRPMQQDAIFLDPGAAARQA